MARILDWLGFGDQSAHAGRKGAHDYSGDASHGHTHGVIDATIATTARGIWAIKWSFVILAITSVLQIALVLATGSVALLADTIHNVGDATTAIPLWIAFVLARRKPTKTFNYGYGRVEDLAGIVIVLIILFSAIVAGYVAINRLIHPKPITELLWVAIAGVIGFLGNEVVAVFRIRVGRQIESAALIADGYHARTDGLTSLAVVLGAVGVWLGFPLADPIIGLLITVAILGIVWQSSKSVLTRMLDGVEPSVVDEIKHAAEHVAGVRKLNGTRARWIGHRLHADVDIDVDDALTVEKARSVAAELRAELLGHFPEIATTTITFGALGVAVAGSASAHGNHHAPDPFMFSSALGDGLLRINDTTDGERMHLTLSAKLTGLRATVTIRRPGRPNEVLALKPIDGTGSYQSEVAPKEPHEFEAELYLMVGERHQTFPFKMTEPTFDH